MADENSSPDLYAALGVARTATDTEASSAAEAALQRLAKANSLAHRHHSALTARPAAPRPTASAVQIRRAFRNLVSKVHPDKGGDAETFRRIQQVPGCLAACILLALFASAIAAPALLVQPLAESVALLLFSRPKGTLKNNCQLAFGAFFPSSVHPIPSCPSHPRPTRQAYEVLSDNAKRREYNETGKVVRSVEDEFMDRWGLGGQCRGAHRGICTPAGHQRTARLLALRPQALLLRCCNAGFALDSFHLCARSANLYGLPTSLPALQLCRGQLPGPCSAGRGGEDQPERADHSAAGQEQPEPHSWV